ncbi:TPA: restriction endonuclease subunit S [Kluyvera intermedia]|uniref:Type I restriction modification DNA specificity domain-containing protein n=2 Tax=Enterobacteriaceae TaxID=543 RepID=A0AAC8QP22_9ENTR|nr:restriction endonuclease subunit S [Phytobacter ursingii]HAT2204708.1 restriction endonuclease subunit S [Kluyvera intermedia]AKL12329.1 hypothetical protein AB182_13905 [Phytobacter ursingii]HAT2515269.1 restriction endonuclease subunit S [Kluyvera intermedia]HAT2603034.1 restriction endonuclease subunit S [Kluyvera intermedia]HAT2679902.1 restriction endonuclease subunit S [Kluyvera intermedia]
MSFETLENLSIKLIDGDRGKNYPKQSDFFDRSDCLFLSAKNVTKNGFEFTDCSYISMEKDHQLRAGKLERNDIVLTTRGTIGNLALYDESVCISNVRINSGMIILRPDTTVWNPRFLYFLLNSDLVIQQISALTSGSAVPQLPARDLKKFVLPVVPLSKQNKIVEIIGAVVDKVQINRAINQTLEQMAQALFKSWFVDFEPVKAKMAALEAGGSQEDATLAAMTAISGKDADALVVFEREYPEQYAELKAMAELFPSAMQESDQGCIPEGWEYRKIGDYIDNISKTYPLKKVEQVVFLNTGDIKEGEFLHQNKSDVGSLPGQAKKSIKEGDILYSEIRPVNKRFAFVYFNADEYVVSTKLMVLRPKSKELSYYLYFLLSSNEVVSYLQLMAESRSGTFPQITYDTVSDIRILTSADESVIKSFCKFVGENLYIPQQSIIKQNDMLTNIRDTLLPKLLSGEITLPEAEQAVSETENV